MRTFWRTFDFTVYAVMVTMLLWCLVTLTRAQDQQQPNKPSKPRPAPSARLKRKLGLDQLARQPVQELQAPSGTGFGGYCPLCSQSRANAQSSNAYPGRAIERAPRRQ